MLLLGSAIYLLSKLKKCAGPLLNTMQLTNRVAPLLQINTGKGHFFHIATANANLLKDKFKSAVTTCGRVLGMCPRLKARLVLLLCRADGS